MSRIDWYNDQQENRGSRCRGDTELAGRPRIDHLLLKKSGLNIDLVNEHEDDVKLAKLLMHKKGVVST